MVCLFFLSYPPTTMIIHGVDKDVEVSFAVGALGGCTLPVLFGLAVDIIEVYSACLMYDGNVFSATS